MGPAPLDTPLLAAVDELLDVGRLGEAKQNLARAADLGEDPIATAYLVTRMLFVRHALDVDGVKLWLREILESSRDFPQAKAMLAAAESGELDASWSYAEWVRIHAPASVRASSAPAPGRLSAPELGTLGIDSLMPMFDPELGTIQPGTSAPESAQPAAEPGLTPPRDSSTTPAQAPSQPRPALSSGWPPVARPVEPIAPRTASDRARADRSPTLQELEV